YIPNFRTYKNEKGIGMLFPIIFTFSLIFFGLGRMINETSHTNMDCKEYVILRKSVSNLSPKTYYIFINNGKRIERLSFGKSFYKTHNVGDKINLCVVTGFLRFRYYKIQSSA